MNIRLAFGIGSYLLSLSSGAQAHRFVNIVKLECQDSVATGTLVESTDSQRLLAIDHFVESCQKSGRFVVQTLTPKGNWRKIADIDPGRGQRDGSIYRFKWPSRTDIRPHVWLNQSYCLSYASLIESNPEARLANQRRVRNLVQTYDSILYGTGDRQAGMVFAVKSVQEDATFRPFAAAFVDFIQRQSTVEVSIGALNERSSRSQITAAGRDLYRIQSPATLVSSMGSNFAVDCEGAHGSSGGALVDRHNQLVGLIVGSENELGAIFNGIGPIGRLMVAKVEDSL